MTSNTQSLLGDAPLSSAAPVTMGDMDRENVKRDMIQEYGGGFFTFADADVGQFLGARSLENCCCSLFCNPCQFGRAMTRAGRSNKEGAYVAGMLILSTILRDFSSAALASAIAEDGALVAGGCANLSVGCGLCLASCIPIYVAARQIDLVNQDWNGVPFTWRYSFYLCFFPCCFSYQLTNAVENAPSKPM